MNDPFVVDLHSHFPIHVLAGDPELRPLRTVKKPGTLVGRLQGFVLRRANQIANYPDDGRVPAVTARSLHESTIRVALSVLYLPFDEMDLDLEYGSPPVARYFDHLKLFIESVNTRVESEKQFVAVALRRSEVQSIIDSKRVALIHAVEGGFHLGDTTQAVQTNVGTLAKLGVAYITVAHLFWRTVATNAPALPFLPDAAYRCLFPQPPAGLGDLGRALITAMVNNGILVDITHMSGAAIGETLDLLDHMNPARTVPVIATHGACRAIFDAEYNLTDEHITRVVQRKGVIGLIASRHWMAPPRPELEDFADTMRVLRSHIDHIEKVARNAGVPEGHHFSAFGSDQDGFIKPAMPGLDFPIGYDAVERALHDDYDAEAVQRIRSGNALRVLDSWGRPA